MYSLSQLWPFKVILHKKWYMFKSFWMIAYFKQIWIGYLKVLSTYNLNFSFHRGLSVCGLTEVARMNLAGRAPPKLSLCSRIRPSFRLKLSLKLWCFLSFSWFPCPSLQASDRERLGVKGWGWGDDGAAIGWMPSMQYGSLKPKQTCSIIFKKKIHFLQRETEL